MEINQADKDLAVVMYDCTEQDLSEAEKLYYRSPRSWLACVKLVVSRHHS